MDEDLHMDEQRQGNLGDLVRSIGIKVAQEWHNNNPEGSYLSPLLASFTARCIMLEQNIGGEHGSLDMKEEQKLISDTLERVGSLNDPLFETVKMQITFESLYATELQKLRAQQVKKDQENKAQLDSIVEVGTNIQSNTQVAALYRNIFKLMIMNSCVDEDNIQRNVEREIAAALESVFPQAGLNAFNMMSSEQKRKQITELVSIVLGIRLFNLEINKGGAGLVDVPNLATQEATELNEELMANAAEMSDICFSYSDILQLEYKKPGTIAASIDRLQDELINRRQFTLLLHQLQHELLESINVMDENKQRLFDEMEQLKTLVGLRSTVPKEQVYPRFHVISATWQNLTLERERNQMRRILFQQLLVFKDSFSKSLLDHDLALVRDIELEEEKTIDPDHFVRTVSQRTPTDNSQIDPQQPMRLVQETTPHFLNLPLEYQGYCPWTIVTRGGLLLPGNPAYGTIVYKGHHFSFASYTAMRGFVEDPETYIAGVLEVCRTMPALLHLLCLQGSFPFSDMSDLFTMKDISGKQQYVFGSTKKEKAVQTADNINTDVPNPEYEWNEWTLRRKALQMADLCNKRTHSTQTELSHFRRDAETQVYLPRRFPDGSVAGVATQTGIDKSTNVRSTRRYLAGLRGHPTTRMQAIEVSTPCSVADASNSSIQTNDVQKQLPVKIFVEEE